MNKKLISILITTKNRKYDLAITLEKMNNLLSNPSIQLVVYDDGSSDATSDFVKQNYPKAIVHRNPISKGYIYCRNKMLNETKAQYAISLDDDAHFISENPLEDIENYFLKNEICGLLGFRIFWAKIKPGNLKTSHISIRVKGFVGCGHAWRMDSWHKIPNYPEWFIFYGEEEFASFQLFKIKYQVHRTCSISFYI